MPPTPTQLGRYEIREELGKGAMGIVFLARDPLIGRLVALKTFRLGFSAGDRDIEQFRARFIREAQSAGILSHPGIVTIHDVVERSEEGIAFIAMEYVRGTNLKALLQGDAPLELAFVADVVTQIAAALDYAHAHGVIHRDVKPANIMLTSDGKVKITDFGIARLDSSNLTQEGQLLGTPNYMAPEQVMGKDVDHRADLFSLGVVLYEMLTGHKPFSGENLTQVSHKIVYEPFTPAEQYVRDLPSALRTVLEKALAKSPDSRYSTAGELGRDLSAVVAGRNRTSHRMDLSETQSVDAFAPPLMAPDLPPPPPLPTLAATEALFLAPRAAAGAPEEPVSVVPTAPPVTPVVAAPVAAIPVVVPPEVSASTPPVSPPPGPRPTAGGPTRPPIAAALRQRLVLAAGAAGITLVAAAAFLVTLSWVGTPLSVSLAPEIQAVESEVIRLRQDGRERLAAGDAAGATMALARAEQLAPGHVGLRDLRQKAANQAAAFAGASGRTSEIRAGLEAAEQALAAKRYDEAAIAAIGVLSRQPDNLVATNILAAVQQAKQLSAPPAGRPGRPIGPRRPAESGAETPERTAEAVGTEVEPAAGEVASDPVLQVSFTTEMAEGVVMIYLDSRQLLRETFRYKTGGFLRSRATGGSFERQLTLAPGTAGQLKVYVTPVGKPAQVKRMQANFPAGLTRRLIVDLPASGAANVQLQ